MTEETHQQRILLLVDDEPNIINALNRTLRRDGYRILTANSAEEGLNLLADNKASVVISDQRMPQMTGVEFFQKVKDLYPNTLRIILSGYTELESVTNAINEGAIYKFLTKPWDDELLRKNVREAFEFSEIMQENQRLTLELQRANDELYQLNQNLEQQVMQKTREITHNLTMLEVSQEILEHLPLAIIGIDQNHMIAASNRLADRLFGSDHAGCIQGLNASDCLPETLLRVLHKTDPVYSAEFITEIVELKNGNTVQAWVGPMGSSSRSKGTIVVLLPLNES